MDMQISNDSLLKIIGEQKWKEEKNILLILQNIKIQLIILKETLIKTQNDLKRLKNLEKNNGKEV